MPGRAPATPRFTIDASVIVNALQSDEAGSAESMGLLAALHAAGLPVILPTLAMVEVASALSRSGVDEETSIRHVDALANLPCVTLAPLSAALAALATKIAAAQRLRGADAVYAAVAWRFGTVLVTRDQEQRPRCTPALICRSPAEALADLRARGYANP